MTRIILSVLALLISSSAFAADWICYGVVNGENFIKNVTLPKAFNPQLDKRIPLIKKDGVVLSVAGDDSYLSFSNGQSLVEVTGTRLYFSDKNIGVVCSVK